MTGDPFFPHPVVCRLLLLLPPETYSFSQFSRRFFVPCLEPGALRRCPPFQKCIQRQRLTNPKSTLSRNPFGSNTLLSQDAFSRLKYNAFHYIHRQNSSLFFYLHERHISKLKRRAILRKLRLHNFNFNFVARNFVISPKKSSLLFRV